MLKTECTLFLRRFNRSRTELTTFLTSPAQVTSTSNKSETSINFPLPSCKINSSLFAYAFFLAGVFIADAAASKSTIL